MDEDKRRCDYVNSISVGNIIAFTVKEEMFSGKVVGIEDRSVTVRTKNGSVYFVRKEFIVWVKTGSRWPIGIYNALKLTKGK